MNLKKHGYIIRESEEENARKYAKKHNLIFAESNKNNNTANPNSIAAMMKNYKKYVS